MSLPKCSECGKMLASKRSARNHYRKEHSGDIETPDEYLERVESEQRDFAGNEPDTSEHDPKYLTENETSDTRRSTLFEHDRTEDSSLSEYTDSEEKE